MSEFVGSLLLPVWLIDLAKMSSVSAEQPAYSMGPLPWSFFSDHSSGSHGDDSVCFMSPGRSGGLNLNEIQYSSSSPTSSDYMNSSPSRFAASRGFEDDRSALSFPDFPDMSCGYESNGDAAAFVQKDARGEMTGIRLNNAFVGSSSPRLEDVFCALQKYLPSNNEDEESLPAVDAYSCDEFRMYEFKVRRCMRGRSHDWTECPFAHPGEKARRRDPRRFHYSGTACPDFRKGTCRRGDACEFAHGVFECWLHPARYRTQPCKDGRSCKRRVCFFAHTPQQLRLLPGLSSPSSNSRSSTALHVASALKNYSLSASAAAYDGSPLRQALEGIVSSSTPGGSLISSPTSTLVGHSQSPPPLSPPLSPSASPPLSPEPGWSNTYRVGLQKAVLNRQIPGHRRHVERIASMPSEASRGLASPRLMTLSDTTSQQQPMGELINSLQSLRMKESSVPSWLQVQPQMVNGGGGLGSPRISNLRHCVVQSLPCTPTHSETAEDVGDWFEEPVQRVESGKDLRAKIYARLTRENLNQDSSPSAESPDVGWVNELVK